MRGYEHYDLDKLARKHTAFESFIDLCTAPGDYTPTIRFDGKGGNEKRYLAGGYDAYQLLNNVLGFDGKIRKSYR
jgi:hypothetical protein